MNKESNKMKKEIKHTECMPDKNQKNVKRSVEINWDETEGKKKSEKEKMTK